MPFDGLANSRLEKNPGYRESAPFFISQKPKRPRKKAFLDSSGLSGADNFGNMISTVRTIGSNNYTTSYSYDLANRVTQIVYPSGRIVNYTYNSSGYLTQVDTKPTSGGTDTVLASSITHKPFGPITGFTYGNSEALTKTYDDNYWISTLNTVYSGTYVQELSFTEDDAGNLTAITDSLASGRDETYTIDALNRLHTASGAYGSRTYTFDNNSNRATRVAGATTYTSTMTTSTNLLASYTDGTSTRHFTYSASGNMLTDDRTFIGGGALSNTFGGRDRLESMTVGTPTVTFKINALGQRVQKATTSTTTDYHFDIFGHIIGEANDGTGANEIEYVWMEGQLLAQIDSSGNLYYVHNNQVGAPQKITDSSRTLVWDYEIEPFGETYATPTSTTPTNHRFPGQYADSEDSLSYNLNRDYDASLGRYPEADPSGFASGLNLYGYAGQSPAQTIDPSGLEAFPVTPSVPLIPPGTSWPNLWNPSGPIYITIPSFITGTAPMTVNIGKADDLPHSEPSNDKLCKYQRKYTCPEDDDDNVCVYDCGDGFVGTYTQSKSLGQCDDLKPKRDLDGFPKPTIVP